MDYYAHGKLLLTGEYVVLHGAKSLTVPTKKGQKLSVEPTSENYLEWSSVDVHGDEWFSGTFDASGHCLTSSNSKIAEGLSLFLQTAKRLGGKDFVGQKAMSTLEFERDWGLGSSSTLTSLLGQWLEIEPMTLHWECSNGSGYDVAIATHSQAGIYQKLERNHHLDLVAYEPNFSKDLYFVHLNQKQNSSEDVRAFLRDHPITSQEVNAVNQLTEEWLNASTLSRLETVINQHEELLSQILNRPTVKSSLFSDFSGSIKSLGAWGGDFVLATGEASKSYFPSKGYQTVLSWSEMVLS
ncbi:MAG: GYDIA family GHMP kinase [Schleiferiaceae bacterium]